MPRAGHAPAWNAWRFEHEAWLRAHAGTRPVEELAAEISKLFDVPRKPSALRIRAKKIGISLWRDGRSMGDLERLFRADHRVILKWWIAPGLLEGTRWPGRGPNQNWHFTDQAVQQFIREHGYAYDWRLMPPGHPLRSLAEVTARRDPYITFDELARHVGINRSNLKEWFKRGYIPHKRRHKAGNGGWIMVRAADVREICDRIHHGQREGIERSRAKFTAMRRAAGRQAA